MSASRVAAAAVLTLVLVVATASAWSATWRLPEAGNDVVGRISKVDVREGETLIDIARVHGLGFNEIVSANPDLDPWLPPVGAEVVLPTRYVLPSAPREGIVVNVAEMRLYYFPPRAPDGSGVVLTFPIGIGQEGWSTPLGITKIVEKRENPYWTVPASVREEYAREGTPLPAVVPPGPDNPLGKHALRLGMTSYLIHGTNKPFGIGMRVSHGCIRMYPEHIERLYHMVSLSTPVWIIDQPVKLGREDGTLYIEAHPPIEDAGRPPADHLTPTLAAVEAVTEGGVHDAARAAAQDIIARGLGMPEPVAEVRRSEPVYAGGWVLQLGAFADRANASRLAGKLASAGAPVSVRAHGDSGYCHVLVGPYDDREVARSALEEYGRVTGRSGELLPADRPGLLSECVL